MKETLRRSESEKAPSNSKKTTSKKLTKVDTIKKEQARTAIIKKQIIEMFLKKTGNIAMMCRELGICRQTYYGWMAEDEKFKKAIDDEKEGLIDFAESKLFNLINEKNTVAIIFFLKTQGKHRGYIEQSDVGISGEIKLNVDRTITSDRPEEM